MKCWIVNNMDECDSNKTRWPATSEEIFEELAKKQGRWGFPENARNLEELKVGDRIIFRRGKFKVKCKKIGKKVPKYSTGKYFIATAIIKSEPVSIEEYKKTHPDARMIGYPSTGVMIIELGDLHEFSNHLGITADSLSFVSDDRKWYSHYQGSIVYCPPVDCEKILKLNK